MGVKLGSGFCPYCQTKVLTLAQTPDHVFHLLASVLTFGIWLIVWLTVIGYHDKRYRCTRCGTPLPVDTSQKADPSQLDL